MSKDPISYLLIFRASLRKAPGPDASRIEQMFGETVEMPSEMRAWIEAIDANPWPLYQDAVIHYSLRGKGRLFSPDRSVPSFVGLHALSATEVQTFVARWPDWLVEAVPMIAESIAVELSMDVVPLSDDC